MKRNTEFGLILLEYWFILVIGIIWGSLL